MKMQSILRRSLLVAGLAVLLARPSAAHEGHQAMGTIRALATTQLELDTTQGKVEVFRLTPSTVYKRGDAAAKREDLAVAERAVVMYETKDGANVVIEVRLGAAALREVERHFVCMINNALFDKPQIPVEVGGKTYFGCCEMCKERLANDPSAREAVDPVSGKKVDKATAVPAATPDGRVLYFESRETLARWTAAGRS